jgi:hypothetical protein
MVYVGIKICRNTKNSEVKFNGLRDTIPKGLE